MKGAQCYELFGGIALKNDACLKIIYLLILSIISIIITDISSTTIVTHSFIHAHTQYRHLSQQRKNATVVCLGSTSE